MLIRCSQFGFSLAACLIVVGWLGGIWSVGALVGACVCLSVSVCLCVFVCACVTRKVS